MPKRVGKSPGSQGERAPVAYERTQGHTTAGADSKADSPGEEDRSSRQTGEARKASRARRASEHKGRSRGEKHINRGYGTQTGVPKAGFFSGLVLFGSHSVFKKL